MDINELSDNVTIAIKLGDLKAFAKQLINEVRVADNEGVTMTLKEVCDVFKRDRTTIYRWEEKGLLKPIIQMGKKLYKREDIMRLLS